VSGLGAILILNDPAPSLNAVSRDKKSPSVRQADGQQILTRFDPDKKSAVLRQKIGSCAASFRLKKKNREFFVVEWDKNVTT